MGEGGGGKGMRERRGPVGVEAVGSIPCVTFPLYSRPTLDRSGLKCYLSQCC